MAVEEFRLPGSGYDELTKIIRAYGHHDADVPLTEIASIAAVHPTIVSRNNAFLIALGIVTSGQRKAITPAGKTLARALDHEMDDAIAEGWRDVIGPNAFFQKLLAAVKIRRGMDYSTLQAHVAYSAGLKKSQAVMTGSATVVQIMEAARVIREDASGKLVFVDEPSASQAAPAEERVEVSFVDTEPVSGVNTARIAPLRTSSGGIQVVIQLQVQCTPDQLDDVAEKLTNLVDRVRAGKAATNE